ncbi:MAG: hypothetical protein WCA10_15710 [Terracidiphilus sp.]
MTRLHTWTRSNRAARPRAYAGIVVLCLALLALLAFVQVAHVHSVDTDADHCSLCIVLHTAAAPAAVAVLVIVLVSFEAVAPVVAIRPLGILWRQQLFIRPPPRLSPASF